MNEVRLKPPKIESMKDLEKELEKWRPVSFKKLSILLSEILKQENEKSVETIKRITNVLEKSRR